MNLFNKKHTSIITICMLLHIVNTAAMYPRTLNELLSPFPLTDRSTFRELPELSPETMQYGMISEEVDEVFGELNKHKLIIPHTITKNSPILLDAQKHNATIPLISALPKISDTIFKHLINPKCNIKTNIQNVLALSAVCTHFDNKLPNLGRQLVQHDQVIINEALRKRLAVINDNTYWNKRRAFFLLVYAGADHNNVYPLYPLLHRAVDYSDTAVVKVLFEHQANPNLRCSELDHPALFSIETMEIAALFTSHKDLDINASARWFPNALWYKSITPELAAFYIDNNINVKNLDEDNQSLLHRVASSINRNSLSTIELFITKIPNLINSLDKKNKTPLDILMKRDRKDKDELILLFQKYGAKTSQELASEQA